MTTPTREQVVQWATDSNGHLVRGAHPGMIGFYPTALDNFATLARADLEATIAELQERLSKSLNLLDADTHIEAELNLRSLKSTIAEQAAEIERYRGKMIANAERSAHYEQRVIEQQAHVVQLREVLENHDGNYALSKSGIAMVNAALSIQSSTDALRQHDEYVKAEFIERSGKWLVNDEILREHDAKLVERIADRNLTAETRIFLAEIADKIRKGKWK